MSDETAGDATFEGDSDEAWRELRRQLADHLAAMSEEQHLVLTVDVGVADGEADGAGPYVQFLVHGGGTWVRAEAVSDHYLDDRWALGPWGAGRLRALGWHDPTYAPPDEGDGGSANWFLDREVAGVDELAQLAVRSLREVYGCPHPVFLTVEGDFAPSGAAAPLADALATAPEAEHDAAGAVERIARRDRIEHPGDHETLEGLVRETLEELNGEPVAVDSDGDFALRVGLSVLFIRVWESEPTVELFAELVTDAADRAAARREADAFNRDAVVGACHVRGEVVRFRYALCAMPFSAAQLRLLVGRIVSDLDERAEEMAERLGGLRFLEDRADREEGAAEASAPDAEDLAGPAAPEPAHPMLLVLRELLEIEEPSDRVVAGLFDGDVEQIAATIAALREDPPADLDVAESIASLRGALVHAARRRADHAVGSRRVAYRRSRSQQSALISPREVDDSGALDLEVDG